MSESISFSIQSTKPFHRRNNSDELGVFEATQYFSGDTENFGDTCKSTSSVGTRNFNDNTWRGFGRMSLDMPNPRGNSIPSQAMDNSFMIKKDKKHYYSKQPSSPGGKLAHFLTSFFNQRSSKKKKSKTKSTQDEDESPSGWRRKRSSISHFWSGNTTSTTTTVATATAAITSDSKSQFSTSTRSGFRTPPFYHVAHTPTKTPTKTTSYKDQSRNCSYLNGNPKKIETFNTRSDPLEKDVSFGNGYLEKVKIHGEKQEHVVKENIKEFKRFVDNDDGGFDSDSSSDLFEITSCDLGYYSSGLPVYETTSMGTIKRGTPILT